ncbi:MAG: transposase domain-containing protein [Myxococcales bacterium]|nr:transposase domain-containing protein [Myxococcales bacterium]
MARGPSRRCLPATRPAAMVYPVTATCKLVGAEPWRYLNDALAHLARHARVCIQATTPLCTTATWRP